MARLRENSPLKISIRIDTFAGVFNGWLNFRAVVQSIRRDWKRQRNRNENTTVFVGFLFGAAFVLKMH